MSLDTDKLMGRLEQIHRAGPDAVRQEMREQGAALLETAKALCPVDTGTLQDSGRIELTENGVAIVFNAPYALAVHERLDVSHANGQAKFLESPVAQEGPSVLQACQRALNEVLD